MRGPIDERNVASCCAKIAGDAAEFAICYELAPGLDGLHEGLAAQRALTALLRQLRGARAESIPIFVSCQRAGERAADYATAWGATEVEG
jgi:hypothetical protein